RCAAVLLDAGKDLLGEPGETVLVDGTTHVRWRFGGGVGGEGRVLLIGHLDTVWPLGTLARWPFTVSAADDRATGPGAFDMKAGLVQLLFALATLDTLDGVTVLVT